MVGPLGSSKRTGVLSVSFACSYHFFCLGQLPFALSYIKFQLVVPGAGSEAKLSRHILDLINP